MIQKYINEYVTLWNKNMLMNMLHYETCTRIKHRSLSDNDRRSSLGNYDTVTGCASLFGCWIDRLYPACLKSRAVIDGEWVDRSLQVFRRDGTGRLVSTAMNIVYLEKGSNFENDEPQP